MFQEIAKELKLNFKDHSVSARVKQESYQLYLGKISFSFMPLLEKNGISIIMRQPDEKFGPYQKDELKSKAKREIIAKLSEIIND